MIDVFFMDSASLKEIHEVANEKFKLGYRMVNVSAYKDNGTRYVICMEIAKFERVGSSE
jgi:hypothetical protein